MQMPGRSFSSGSYRYGFQGQEKDDEIKGDGNSINYKYRVHDTRLGRFLSLDPLAPDYPWNSPYAFSENRVIDGIELEGREWSVATVGDKTMFTVKLKVINETSITNEFIQNSILPKLKKAAKKVFKKNFPNGQFDINIVFDNKINNTPVTEEQIQNPDGFYLQLVTTSHSGKSYPGGESSVGETQFNVLTVEIESMDKRNEYSPILPVTYGEMIINFLHELGHSGGLFHPWDDSNNTGDVDMMKNDQGEYEAAVGVGVETIKNNIMNSYANPGGSAYKPPYNEKKQNVLTPGQAETIKKEVEDDIGG
jgi:RHS repeat-associated protein